MAAETGAALAVLHCRCSDDAVWRDRIEARKAPALPAHQQTDWQAFQPVRARFDAHAGYPMDVPCLELDTVVRAAVFTASAV